MATIDLTLSSDEKSPPIASTSRSSNPTHLNQQPRTSTENRQNDIKGGTSSSNRVNGSGSGKNGRPSLNGNDSFSVGSSSSSSQSKGKGKAPVEIEISSDNDDDESRNERLKAAANRRRSIAAKKVSFPLSFSPFSLD